MHFQQTRQGFYEPLLIGIGLAEGWRILVGWADATQKGPFTLKDKYVPGDLRCELLCSKALYWLAWQSAFSTTGRGGVCFHDVLATVHTQAAA